jgi:tight adherence protein C
MKMTLTSNNFPLILSFLTFSVLFLLAFSVLQYVRENAKKRKLLSKIKQQNVEPVVALGGNSASRPQDEPKKAISRLLDSIGKRVIRNESGIPKEERIRFLRAGLKRQNVARIFWGAKILTGALLCVGAFLFFDLAFGAELSLHNLLLISVFLGFLGLYLPNIWLRVRIAKRKRRIFEGFPDALDLVVVCLEAGMGMDSAINRVGEEIRAIHKDLSDELKLLGLELRAGMSRKDALRNFATRTDLEEVRNLVTLIAQTDRFGTSAASALRVYSDNFRAKRYQKGEEKAIKLPVKMIIPMILCILPAMVVAILGPIAIKVHDLWVSTGH